MGKGTTWRESDLRKLGQSAPPHSRAVKIPKQLPPGVQRIKNTLTLLGIEFVTEYMFHDERKFRFDFALPDQKIAIEFEGLMSEKSRHTTVGGYTSDCEKYNLATKEGWRLLRYTIVNVDQVADDLKKLIKNNQ